MPHISGTDISGTVEEVGEEVTSVRKGDRWYLMEI
jgi:NADPH:quinone reductase-like Zn-dependent oxidoreductase